MHWKRWLTAGIAAPFLVYIILRGGSALFLALVIIAGSISLWEYFRIVYQDHEPAVPRAYEILAYITGALLLIAVFKHHWHAVLGVLSLNLIVAAFFSVRRFQTAQDGPLIVAKQILGILYICVMLSFAVMLHQGKDGALWTLFLIWVVAWGDTGALYTGSYLGRHKLCPAVSPKKTIEGAFGGLAANLVFGLLFKVFLMDNVSVLSCIVFSLAVGVVGQIGDLFESEFKRAVGVKDSGALLPGHGGILDRIDAILFALPVGFLLKEFLLT